MVGYFDLPPGFACAFIGGWLYAFPALLSVFYSCCIALNSQLYLVFRREPKEFERGMSTLLKWYISAPIALSGIICESRLAPVRCVVPHQSLGFSALAASLYGYDSVYGYCWYASPPVNPDYPHQRHLRSLVGMVTTFGGWCLLALLYLLFASTTVAWVVFFKLSDVDIGGHLGLRRDRGKFTSEGSIPTPSTSDLRWVGHTPTSSTGVEMQRKGRFHTVQFEDREKASPTPASDDHQRELRAEDEQEEWNTHIFLRNIRYSSSEAHSSRIEATTTPAHQGQPKISRRTLALRAMTFRLIGYILIPVICILPGVITDLIVKAYPVGEVYIPDLISGFCDGMNGLVGFFNAMLFLLDPVLLVVWAELRANHRWGLLQRQRTTSQYADHENRSTIDADAMDLSPLQDTRTPRSNGTGEHVGGTRSTCLGKECGHPPPNRPFGDYFIPNLLLPKPHDEQRSPRLTEACTHVSRIRGTSLPRLQKARDRGAARLAVHMQVEVEVTTHSDLERVEDYLHGL